MELTLRNFQLLTRLLEYVKEHNLSEDDIKLFLENNNKISVEYSDVELKDDIKEDIIDTVKIISLNDHPKVLTKIGDDNIIYVNETSQSGNSFKIKFMDRFITLSLNESMNDEQNIVLDLVIDDNVLYNIPFKIKESPLNKQSYLMEIKKELLCQNQKQ